MRAIRAADFYTPGIIGIKGVGKGSILWRKLIILTDGVVIVIHREGILLCYRNSNRILTGRIATGCLGNVNQKTTSIFGRYNILGIVCTSFISAKRYITIECSCTVCIGIKCLRGKVQRILDANVI